MEISEIVIAVIAVTSAIGGAAAFYGSQRGKGTVKLLQANIEAYKDSEKLKDQRIAYLEGQLVIKDETIKRLLNETSHSTKG